MFVHLETSYGRQSDSHRHPSMFCSWKSHKKYLTRVNIISDHKSWKLFEINNFSPWCFLPSWRIPPRFFTLDLTFKKIFFQSFHLHWVMLHNSVFLITSLRESLPHFISWWQILFYFSFCSLAENRALKMQFKDKVEVIKEQFFRKFHWEPLSIQHGRQIY